MDTKQKIFIIIPTYNEAENIGDLIQAIFNLEIPGINLVIIDDNSTDGTGKIIDEISKNYPIIPIHRPKKLGLGSAYLNGFKISIKQGADLVFEMDADFSHDPKDISRMIEAINSGADVAIGSRRIQGGKVVGWNLWRKFCSNGAMFFSRLILGLKTRDVTAGYRCYKRLVLESINLDKIKSNGYAFQEEMIYLCEKKGFLVKEVPVTFKDREKGKSKLNWKEIVHFFIIMLKLRFRK